MEGLTENVLMVLFWALTGMGTFSLKSADGLISEKPRHFFWFLHSVLTLVMVTHLIVEARFVFAILTYLCGALAVQLLKLVPKKVILRFSALFSLACAAVYFGSRFWFSRPD